MSPYVVRSVHSHISFIQSLADSIGVSIKNLHNASLPPSLGTSQNDPEAGGASPTFVCFLNVLFCCSSLQRLPRPIWQRWGPRPVGRGKCVDGSLMMTRSPRPLLCRREILLSSPSRRSVARRSVHHGDDRVASRS